MTIHHATAKRAETLGIRLEETETGVVAFIASDDGTEYPCPEEPSAKEAVDKAAEYLSAVEAGDLGYEDLEVPEEETATASVVKDRYKKRYAERGDPTSCGDDMAAELKNATVMVNEKGNECIDMAAVRTIAVDNDLEEKHDAWVAKGLNNGMVRMNLGNMLRAKFRRGEAVAILGHDMVPEYEDDE